MPSYDSNWVKSYFNEYGMREWQRWDLSPVEQMKLEIHLHYLHQYIKPTDRILEIGAGAGRITRELAQISDRINVADISPIQLQLNRENAQNYGYSNCIERWVECDMCNLQPYFAAEEFDAVVCYGGPLSYVFGERHAAISELLRVTRSGGLLILGVMSLWGTIHQFFADVLEFDQATNADIISSGDLRPDRPDVSTHFCHMYRAAEFRKFLEKAGLKIEAMSASDCLSATWADALVEVKKNEAAWRSLVAMEIEACREPGCLDMGTHMIAVCRKPVPCWIDPLIRL